MKKTLTANISGTVFHIEEDAYEAMNRYLDNIRAQFAGTDGREEIMSDIEARIAELLHERLDGRRQVVSMADVEHVVATMGQPEDFTDDGSEGSPDAPPTSEVPPGKRYKRLLRDPDDKWVAGVLSGLAAYIGMDPLWLRVAMIVLVWASVGVLIPIYILLWILVPKADNAADRLRMRGEPVTVENIRRVVEEGTERMASEAKDLGKQWRNSGSKRGGEAARILGKLAGVALIVIAFSMLLSLITGVIGGTFGLWNATWTNEDMGLLDLGGLLFASRSAAMWMAIGVFALLAIPIIGLFLLGFRLLLNTRMPKWLGWSLIILWVAALVPTIWGGVNLGRDFHRENTVRTEETLVQPTGSVLYLDALNVADETEGWSMHFNDGALDVDMDGLHVADGNIFGAWARLDVEASADSLYHLVVIRQARGVTAKAALARAEEIHFRVEQQGDVLFVSPLVSYAVTDKFRAQDVQFTLEVPLGKSIFLRPGSKAVIYDIDNVTNTSDHKMLGRTWTMTEGGLEDPNAPSKLHQEKAKEEEIEPAKKDSSLTGKVAAEVYRGPSPKKATARADVQPLQLPSLLALIRPR
ncbi:MAG: PspC domain-containing protein [Flavobacteriales bacterium]|nr:PspC domain-containing protein [Flavobacteriales bacterium]MCC6939600.1 PspC domain-containing protein [Flavobacteriales bacterium]